jgi:tRNA pseudouridine55 synthase
MTKQTPVTVNGQELSAGVFLVDKPVGQTSFAVVKKIRWLLGIKKVGHAGTLDPFASGLLIICAGRPATRHIDDFMAGRKTYQAVLQLGQETETQDPEGEITAVRPVPELSQQDIVGLSREFVGSQMQAPPPYSAAKHKGKPLYHYARKGIIIEKEPKPIEIYSLQVDDYDPVTARLTITVSCSRGTYIRVLGADIGKKIGCGGHLIALRRTHSGRFAVAGAILGEQLFADNNAVGSDGLNLLLNRMMTLEQALERC